MLYQQKQQGVTTVCLTPHFRTGTFETSDADILYNYKMLIDAVSKISDLSEMNFVLGREYYCDESFLDLVRQKRIMTIGNTKYVLVEFCYDISYEEVLASIKEIIKYGYIPIIAHVERYPFVSNEEKNLRGITEAGALMQINTEIILSERGIFKDKTFTKYLSKNLIDFVASDCHHATVRIPNLGKCKYYPRTDSARSFEKNVGG